MFFCSYCFVVRLSVWFISACGVLPQTLRLASFWSCRSLQCPDLNWARVVRFLVRSFSELLSGGRGPSNTTLRSWLLTVDSLVIWVSVAPDDTTYKWWSCYSGFVKLLCKLCRTPSPPALGSRFFLGGKPTMRTRWVAGAAHKGG